MLTLFNSAVRGMCCGYSATRTLSTCHQAQTLTLFQSQPHHQLLQSRGVQLSAFLEKKSSGKGEGKGKCPRNFPVKFPLCVRHIPCKPKPRQKCPSNPLPKCRPPNNCKYVDPRKVQEANRIDQKVQAQLKEERRIRSKKGYPPKKKKKERMHDVTKSKCPRNLCPKKKKK